MRRTGPQHLQRPEDERVRRLEGELYLARRDIVELMPDAIAGLMRDYHGCRTREDHYAWEKRGGEAAIDLAEPDPAASHWQPRARCPLCRGGSSGPYDISFTIPEGLRRHLEGFGNVRQCPRTRAAFSIAHDALEGDFVEADCDAAAQTEQRRRTERVYDVGPRKPGMLLD